MQKVTITATINDDKIEELVRRFNKNRGLIAKVIDTLFDVPDVTITAMVEPVEPSPRKLVCQSTNHKVPKDCYGELWQCAGCGRVMCAMEGADDDYPLLCDDCFDLALNYDMHGNLTKEQEEYLAKYNIESAEELLKVGQ